MRSANQIATRVDGFVERSVVRCILQELNHFVDLFFKHKLATAFPLELRGGTQENQNRQRKFALSQIGAERFASRALAAGKIDAIIVNLIRRPDLKPEIFECFDHVGIGLANERGQFRCSGEKRSRFHFNDAQIILDGQSEIEPALRLDHFSRANRRGGTRNRTTDIGIFEIRR